MTFDGVGMVSASNCMIYHNNDLQRPAASSLAYGVRSTRPRFDSPAVCSLKEVNSGKESLGKGRLSLRSTRMKHSSKYKAQ